MLEKIKELLTKDTVIRLAAVGILIVLIVFLALFVWIKFFRGSETVVQSQQEAQTTAGVQAAATKAGTKLDSSQASSVAKQIKYIYETNQAPTSTVKTTAANVTKEAEQAKENSGADFAILTDKNNPDQQIDIDKLDKDTPVEINQYNVQAYKKVIRSVEYYPTEKIAGLTVQRKITNDGQYVGVGASYDFDDKKVYAKIVYSW